MFNCTSCHTYTYNCNTNFEFQDMKNKREVINLVSDK